MKIFTNIINNTILDKVLKDGFYEINITKKRSEKQHRTYWWLMEFFSIHSPEYLCIENMEDSHEFFKYRLGKKVYNHKNEIVNIKPVSIKYANMPQHEFNTHFDRMFNVVCYELSADKYQVDEMFTLFKQEKQEKMSKMSK